MALMVLGLTTEQKEIPINKRLWGEKKFGWGYDLIIYEVFFGDSDFGNIWEFEVPRIT